MRTFTSPLAEETHIAELREREEEWRAQVEREHAHDDPSVDGELVPTRIKRAEAA